MEYLLEAKGISLDLISHDIVTSLLKGLNLKIGYGERIVLAGESGSGKTLTALSLTKNLPQEMKIVSGSVEFLSQDLLRVEERKLERIRGKEISYIFQEPSAYLNPVLLVKDQIQEAIMLHQNLSKKESLIKTEELLSFVHLDDAKRVMDSYPHQLSGGMNQRVFIAMSLACNPKLLIADEPTTSLDVTIESQILNLIVELQREKGFSLLFITHNLSIAQKIADRIYVMHQGQIVEEGNREEIFLKPKHFHTRELIEAFEKIGRI